ncbi:MAG TPA: hypothetical protein PLG09_09780 [Syntrophomonadaceae bacterium]|nr:hypothetical protein [Syntrophomonadaceae bacterium]HPU48272.1 hypothetical protein [Syntrophomonadaceae bacterium]
MTAIYYFLISAASLIILLILGSGIASRQFKYSVDSEIKELLPQDFSQKGQITSENLHNLPDCVQHWLRNSQIIGRERIHKAMIRQKGQMKTSPEGKWMPFAAVSYYNVDQPGFIWHARVNFAPGVKLLARDKYFSGIGSMLIKLMGIFPVVNLNNNEEINQGSLLRYLAETVWFPSAAVSSEIRWEEIDPYTAKATMEYKGVTGSGIFKFNDRGEVVEFKANRPRAVGDHFELTPWSIYLTEYHCFDGIQIPSKGEVIWELAGGDFNWFQFEVQEAEYNF